MGVIKGDTRSLDYSSNERLSKLCQWSQGGRVSRGIPCLVYMVPPKVGIFWNLYHVRPRNRGVARSSSPIVIKTPMLSKVETMGP